MWRECRFPAPAKLLLSVINRSSGNSTLVLHSAGGPIFDASDGNFLRDRGNALASSTQSSRLLCCHIVRRASDTHLPLVRVPVPLATCTLLTGFHSGTLYLCASWRTRGMIVDDNQCGTVSFERLFEYLAHPDQRCVERANVDRDDAHAIPLFIISLLASSTHSAWTTIKPSSMASLAVRLRRS